MVKTGRLAWMAFDSTQRAASRDKFLKGAGWSDAIQQPLSQDASTRNYIRLVRGDETAMLMDAPRIESAICTPNMSDQDREELGWNAQTRLAASRVDAFVVLAAYLRGLGLGAPEVYAHDVEQGFAIIEDFGTQREFARLIEAGTQDEVHLYTEAAKRLAKLHQLDQPSEPLTYEDETWHVLEFDGVALKANADLYADWLPLHAGEGALRGKDRVRWGAARNALIERAVSLPREFTLRDYHAENLLWLERGDVGLLDFQDAVIGWDAWDMAMLTQDARREVSDAAAEAAITTYLDLTGKSRDSFDERLAIIGTLNALRIAGLFSRLMNRDKKPRYGDFFDRQIRLLAKNLEHPSTSEMKALVSELTPFVFECEAR